MNNSQQCKIIVVCGSAGSLPVIIKIIEALPAAFVIPVVIIIHRQRNVLSEMTKIFSMAHPDKKIIEPNDKEVIANGGIYLAPQNYHLLFENDRTFSLDYSEPVHYSRPSFDVSLESAAAVFKQQLTAVLLSGANNDGAVGLQHVRDSSGTAIVQDPDSAQYPTMPRSAINKCQGVQVLKPEQIISFITKLADHT